MTRQRDGTDGIGGFPGTAVVAGLAILCCAGPLLVVAIAGLGIEAWLSAHGLWLLGGFGLLVGTETGLVVYRRTRSAPTRAGGERRTDHDRAARL